MTASTPSSISRYRPAVLFLTGISAGYGIYLIYNFIHTPAPSDGLHLQRRNAIRRRRPRDAPQTPALPLSEGHVYALGVYDFMGVRLTLDANNLIQPHELRDLIVHSQANTSPDTIRIAIANFYDEFFNRLLVALYPDQPLSSSDIASIQDWLNHRYPHHTAIGNTSTLGRAVQRHAESFPLRDAPAHDDAESIAPTELSVGSEEDPEDGAIDPEGQTLQRTLYHIAEDRARLEGVVHRGITCNGCDEKPIRGTRWHCANCPDFDLCSNCEATNSHPKTHIFYKIRVPAPFLSLEKQEPLYPGKPHMMCHSIHSPLKRRLVAETKMEAEEIEALWDQFTCLAGTEWTSDPSNIGWAIDRREFNHAFVPRYKALVSAPNLVYDRIFAYYDTDKNGLIGFDEWVKGLDGMHTTDIDVKARIVFNGYDIDGDGYISRKDILRIFRAFFAIEKEATHNHIRELSDDLTVRNALDTIQSSQPLGSAFPPRSMNGSNAPNARLQEKQENADTPNSPLLENHTDVAERDEILRAFDSHYITPGHPWDGSETDIVSARWARRQYYIDEEEGLARPNEVEMSHLDNQEANDEVDQAPAQVLNDEQRRYRDSRSSSRVRFQDDIEIETRSNASSSRPVGERWGGYDIPEPEQNLSNEVLYQITQQGFNEMLDPLFLEKEDMAMDAHETRSKRREMATAIESTTNDLFTKSKADVEAIAKVGIFRFSKCLVRKFIDTINQRQSSIKQLFQNPANSNPLTEKDAHAAIEGIYDSLEARVIRSIGVSKTPNLDNTMLWNTLLCRRQLREETVDAVIQCALKKGWLAYPSTNGSTAGLYKDPTMPQYRPNSLAHPNSRPTTPDSPEIHSASGSDDFSLGTHEGPTMYSQLFVSAYASNYQFREELEIASMESETREPRTSTPPVVVAEPDQPSQPDQEANKDLLTINWRNYTDAPEMYDFFTTDSDEKFIRCMSTTNCYSEHDNSETGHLKSLHRSVRNLAMNPSSSLHLIMLASLEVVEQEITQRKGSGLISFDEFLKHMREGRLRFLEAWMDWVSM
ncbi:FRQ1 Ca2+-binding protein EF-Hand superfamily [Pyrenophora tritici-repentis]|uniref:Ef hand domain protein n=2 Tax=Pyrenophora tritici-repentis TaxID=45151 RepID=A0A2W1GPP7_9PLEO|nr:EF hand domain containing protein [Pyrenophora tritici-repentis Pt-1C-BFP]KAA8614804.1 ef hand domain protein [Pyrenophora tritici-repentis]EDU50153.1 EF hand domain containing protein [Pyrenophora tritici-repentis Pt-1C-BFP]KAF7444628.1 ef hand domain protein [Pyrenophora tritici-repentis]KAF7564715.1 FRQ1, Ca2+-binding protein (EF-Hand superfamily) [Pyrenophora tritici-repentis]KAG9378874.1 ef hand domain protein [Pyrenophora tritici-repentis]